MAFSFIAVASDTDIAILDVQNQSFGRPGASILSPGIHFASLGTPWGTMGAAGRTCGGLEPDFV